jgi:hypothetical protein
MKTQLGRPGIDLDSNSLPNEPNEYQPEEKRENTIIETCNDEISFPNSCLQFSKWFFSGTLSDL